VLRIQLVLAYGTQALQEKKNGFSSVPLFGTYKLMRLKTRIFEIPEKSARQKKRLCDLWKKKK
jgi:hypothetical protein